MPLGLTRVYLRMSLNAEMIKPNRLYTLMYSIVHVLFIFAYSLAVIKIIDNQILSKL